MPLPITIHPEFALRQRVWLLNSDLGTGIVIAFVIQPEQSIQYRVRWGTYTSTHYAEELESEQPEYMDRMIRDEE